MFFADQLAAGLPVNTVASRLDIEGALDSDLFRECLVQLVQRHRALRTNYLISDSGAPIQIANAHVLQVALVELNSDTEEAERQQIQAEICTTKFDLTRDL